jgi:hypothetical protein
MALPRAPQTDEVSCPRRCQPVRGPGRVSHSALPCLLLASFWLVVAGVPDLVAGELVVDLGKSEGVEFVGALRRWDRDGNPRVPVDPKAKINVPVQAIKARRLAGNRWSFRELPKGRYDLVILAGRVRVEGFHYPPVSEFDPPLSPDAKAPEDARAWIVKDIANSRHFENKVVPLYLGGTEKQVRVLVQKVRDRPTSFDAKFGEPVATIRHEIWQYTNRYGGWSKDKTTKVLDRILLARKELQRWTWVWEPKLGGIEVKEKPLKLSYQLPRRFDARSTRGWFSE